MNVGRSITKSLISLPFPHKHITNKNDQVKAFSCSVCSFIDMGLKFMLRFKFKY